MKSPLKIALVFDWMTDCGGMEHVNLALADAFPNAEIFCPLLDFGAFPQLRNRKVHTSFLQKLPKKWRAKHRYFLPFFPRIFQSYDFSKFDLILSSTSSGFAKLARKTQKNQIHICYCHCPVRYLHHAKSEYISDFPLPKILAPARFFLPKFLQHLAKKDVDAAQKVDHFVANSVFISKRISKFYHRDSQVIFPGVSTQSFLQAGQKNQKSDFFFAVGRFVPYKNFHLLVETFAKFFPDLPLKLGGTGPELERCKTLAKKLGAKNIEFLGFVPQENLPDFFARARGFLFPAEEDFGITPVESMAAGTPIIFLAKGGARESVPKFAGTGFDHESSGSLRGAVSEFLQQKNWDSKKISAHAKKFERENFIRSVRNLVEKVG